MKETPKATTKQTKHPVPAWALELLGFTVVVRTLLLLALGYIALIAWNPYNDRDTDESQFWSAILAACFAMVYILPYVLKKVIGYGPKFGKFTFMGLLFGPGIWLAWYLLDFSESYFGITLSDSNPLALWWFVSSGILAIVGIFAILVDTLLTSLDSITRDLQHTKSTAQARMFMGLWIGGAIAIAAAAYLAFAIPARMSNNLEKYDGAQRQAALEALDHMTIFASQPQLWRVDSVERASPIMARCSEGKSVSSDPGAVEHYRVTLSRIELFGLQAGERTIDGCDL